MVNSAGSLLIRRPQRQSLWQESPLRINVSAFDVLLLEQKTYAVNNGRFQSRSVECASDVLRNRKK